MTREMANLTGSGSDSDIGKDVDTDEEQAGMQKHKCTDFMCFAIFFAAFIPVFWILDYSVGYTDAGAGDIRRLYHGYDFLGRLCGVDSYFDTVTNQTVMTGEFLYWCKEETPALSLGLSPVEGIDLKHPVCVAACPTSAETVTSCYIGHETKPVPLGPGAVAGSFIEETKYNFDFKKDYDTFVFAYRYCLPRNATMMEEITQELKKSWAQSFIMDMWGVLNSWLPLCLAGGLAFILGYAYLFIINKFAKPLVYGCLIILSTAPIGVGGYFIHITHIGGADGIPSTGDANYDYAVGSACCILGVILGILSCCAGSAIQVAIGCVQAACNCMFDMKSLLIEPVISLTFKMGCLALMSWGFFWLLSTGTMQRESLQQMVAAELPGGGAPAGVARSFSYNEEQMKMIAYYIFMMFWVAELCTALSHFVLSYCTQLWYFTPYEDGKKHAPGFPIFRGYKIGIQYHLGSLAFGSFLVAVLRMVRLIVGYIAKQMQDTGNSGAACAAKACLCVVDCFKRTLEFINKNAYMDIAIRSTNFCEAAKHAVSVIAGNVANMAILNGATWVFQFAGVGSITAAGTYLTLLMIRNMETFTRVDSPHYIPDPVAVLIVAGLICFMVSVAFMIIFDTVADTILYCFAIEKERRSEGKLSPDTKYSPDILDNLIRDHTDT